MSIFTLVWVPIGLILQLIEGCLFMLINIYDEYCYTPLQTGLSPLVARVPRYIHVNGRKLTVFTANIVSWSRTALVIPVVWCVKYDYTFVAFSLILFHDFLDHLDGIVAKVQKTIYGQLDDPLLGGFMDAFCDKIVNCLSLWSILVLTDYSSMTTNQILLYVSPCVVIIVYEAVLGVVRVQDYFKAYYDREYGRTKTETAPNVAAVMEGKLKEKLESMGIAFLCLAQVADVPVNTLSGCVGLICLVLSVRLAHASLQHKLKARNKPNNPNDTIIDKSPIEVGKSLVEMESVAVQVNLNKDFKRRQSVFDDYDSDLEDDEEKSDLSEKEEEVVGRPRTISRSQSVPAWNQANMVDRVYTVGCFDLFHDGHVKLLMRLKGIGRKVIVGVHDSRSIYKLKKRVPIDDTCKRMDNVKKYADVVYCVSGTEPAPYLQCVYDHDDHLTSMYVRGDDMKNFPAREFMEKIMPVHFLPYTQSVSSTKIRKEVYNASMFGPHVKHDDHTMFY